MATISWRYFAVRHIGQVNYIYIDPPYNTNSTPILYKMDPKQFVGNAHAQQV